nr:hypothetical protein [Acidobacteriota bacterium]
MNRPKLAARLVQAEDEAGRLALLGEYPALADSLLGRALKDVCLDGLRSDPA